MLVNSAKFCSSVLLNSYRIVFSIRKYLLCVALCSIHKVQDPDLNGVSHVLVDEIHERGMNEDFLIIILRDLLLRRPDLRLVLMSATINADLFSKYFNNCPIIHIPVRIHESFGFIIQR
mgnify:FL=1